MKKKSCQLLVLFAIIAIILCGALRQKMYQIENLHVPPRNSTIETKEAKSKRQESEKKNFDRYYGFYRVKEYFPWEDADYQRQDFQERPQEADMMLGLVIEIRQDKFITYDMGKRKFRNYMLNKFEVESPQYESFPIKCSDSLLSDQHWMIKHVGGDYYQQVEGVLIAKLSEKKETTSEQNFFAMKDSDEMVMFSNVMSGGYFVLEKLEEEPEPANMNSCFEDSMELLEEIYGDYQITEFIPTKYYGKDSTGERDLLPEEEAGLMLGKIVTFSKDLFVTYDNYRQPSSSAAKRAEDSYWLAKIEIENPEYQVKNMREEEIYGLRDGILTRELKQPEYVEIDVYPGYVTNGYASLPQLYLLNDGRIAMYAMGEYFLLERIEGSEKKTVPDYIPDLSGWIGRYAFSEEKASLYSYKWGTQDKTTIVQVTREYEIEIKKNDSGEYNAEIVIHEIENGTDTRIMANVYGSSETISIVFKETLSGENDWIGYSDILLRFQKEADGIYTYWGGLNDDRESGKYFEKVD